MAVSRFVNVTAEVIYALKENAKFGVTLFTFAPTPYKQLIHIKQTTRKMRLFRSVFKVGLCREWERIFANLLRPVNYLCILSN